MSRKPWVAAFCLGAVTLLGGDRLVATDSAQLEQLKSKMTKEGWTEVAEGVFERQLGPNKVERIGYGRAGHLWNLADLDRRLERLRHEQELYPSAQLAQIIEELSERIETSKLELRELDFESGKELSNAVEAVTGGSCSSICYSATADAYPLTATQGVGAVANASFNSACGYSGETYAYAYARATVGTTTSTSSQSDPDTGTSITSSATATANGGSITGTPCYSEASSYAESTALGISYSTSDTNSSCPLVCTATISGPTDIYLFKEHICENRTWTVALSGSGCTASSYQWKYNGTVVVSATGSSFTHAVCAPDASAGLEVTVNGAYSDTHGGTVYYYCGQGPTGYCAY